jgi:hypothetical protein
VGHLEDFNQILVIGANDDFSYNLLDSAFISMRFLTDFRKHVCFLIGLGKKDGQALGRRFKGELGQY